jgi:hypothetical protein
VAGSREYSNEPSGYIKGGKFLDPMSDYQLLKDSALLVRAENMKYFSSMQLVECLFRVIAPVQQARGISARKKAAGMAMAPLRPRRSPLMILASGKRGRYQTSK